MKLTYCCLVFAISMLFGGCIERNQGPPSINWTNAPPSAPTYAVVRVFYATDRSVASRSEAGKVYGCDRGVVTYGTCQVSIPRDHQMGELEGPAIWKLEFHQDPEKHVVFLGCSFEAKEPFFSQVAARVSDSQGKKAFVFVHGYNVTFEDAARRTAQISYDLGFDGAAVFYSWPSQGTVTGYPIDESNIEWTQTNLKTFLADFLKHSDAQNIYLIAHSMGNRTLTRAFATLIT